MEGTTLETLIEDIYNDLGRLRKLCDNYIFIADYVRFVDVSDVSDEADSFKEVFDKALIEILSVADSIKTKCQID